MSEPSSSKSDQTESSVTPEDIEDAVVVNDADDQASDSTDSSETDDYESSSVPAPVQQTVIVEKLGFGRLIFGGAAAAGLGFLGAWLGLAEGRTDPTEQLTAQAAEIEALQAEIAALSDVAAPEAPDLTPLTAGIEAVTASVEEVRTEVMGEIAGVTETLGAVEASVGGLDERLVAVERQPGEDGQVTDTAIASFERELEELRGQFTEMSETTQAEVEAAQAALVAARAETEAAAQAAREEAEAAAAEAEAAAEQAQAEARQAEALATLSQLRLALDAGEPFGDQIETLTGAGVDVPEALAAVAADGIASQQDLQGSFPEAARAALAASRDAGDGAADEEGGFGSFFRDQLGVRSTEPREGSGADAVLSRAEAAVRDGDLATALTEIDALPDSAKSALEAWLGTAQSRADALTAADTIEQQLNNE